MRAAAGRRRCLHLGRRSASGNQFLRRCKQLFLDKKELSVTTEGEKEQVIFGRPAVFRFTALQVLCLAVLWALGCPSTALIFPSVIGVLMLVRVQLIPKLFTARELMLLDTAIGATSARAPRERRSYKGPDALVSCISTLGARTAAGGNTCSRHIQPSRRCAAPSRVACTKVYVYDLSISYVCVVCSDLCGLVSPRRARQV